MVMPKGPGHRALRKGRHSYSGAFYFITTSTKNRAPIFINESAALAAIEAFTAPWLLTSNTLFCWVLMPDHVHWLVQLGHQDSISDLVGKMKAASARFVRQAGYSKPVWDKAFYESRVRESSATKLLSLRRISLYIANNPKKAGLIKPGSIYPYWSGAAKTCGCYICRGTCRSGL